MAELGGHKQTHPSSLPLPTGHSRVEVQPFSRSWVPEPTLCVEVSPTISSRYLSTTRTSSGSFPPGEVTFHVPRASVIIRRSGYRCPILFAPVPHGSPCRWFATGDSLESLVWVWPGRVPQGATQAPGTLRRVPTPGLAPGWDPGSAVPRDVTCLNCVFLTKAS
ncbi:hypothetical protein ATANTOWER_030609 [Ataeniobius toweri]|uniref:Uncharacterized protein n=1 Tax=Ataeniobius toweri TaxID=208326 RepID=A0ABU7BJ89_9TELE|nr:hypothetical protein [Ataeniobius toweri]